MASTFERDTGIKVSMTRKSNGEIFAQLKAEASNPKGDIWWGGTGDPHPRRPILTCSNPTSPRRWASYPWAVAQGSRQGPDRRHLFRRARLRLQHQAARRPRHSRTECWADLLNPEAEGRDPGRRSEFVRHVLRHGRHRAGDGRGKGVRVPEGPAQEHRPVHQVGRRPGAPWRSARPRSASPSSTTWWRRSSRGRKAIKVVSPCEGTGFEIGSMSIVKGAKHPGQRQEVL